MPCPGRTRVGVAASRHVFLARARSDRQCLGARDGGWGFATEGYGWFTFTFLLLSPVVRGYPHPAIRHSGAHEGSSCPRPAPGNLVGLAPHH